MGRKIAQCIISWPCHLSISVKSLTGIHSISPPEIIFLISIGEYIPKEGIQPVFRNIPVHPQVIINSTHHQIRTYTGKSILIKPYIFIAKKHYVSWVNICLRQFRFKLGAKSCMKPKIGYLIACFLFQKILVQAKC